jgi:DNA-directed RNA polymerase specialized sigma subunit, sigma24 homolog
MKNYKDSDYALNKHSNGIVYRFADKIVEVTLEDYLTENPGKTEDDFLKLKAFSDADYLSQDRLDYKQSWKNSSISDLDEAAKCETPSPEESMIAAIDKLEEIKTLKYQAKLAGQALDRLTEIQRRRYLLHHVGGWTMRKIAESEGVGHTKIQKSLEAADKKIKKFLSES